MGGQRLGAAHDAHRFHLLLAHHRAAAVLGGHVAVVAVDGREAHEVLARGTDRVDREPVAGEAVLGLERLLGLPGVLAGQVGRVAHLDHVVVDVEVGELLGLPLHDDGVVARVLERGAEEAVGLRRRGAAGQRAAGDHGEPARAPHRQAGQGPGGHDEAVVGMIPLHLRADLLVEDLGAEPDAPQVLAPVGLAPGLGPGLAGGEVHAEQLAGIRIDGRRRGLGGGACRGRGRAHRATVWGSWGDCDGRPRMVWGSSREVVWSAMNAGLTSNGFACRCAFQVERSTPE